MGFVKVPVELIDRSSELGISDGMFKIIIAVLQFARPGKLPFPSSKTIADICGVDERTVQERAKKLEKLGYLKRPKGGKKPYWDLSGLFDALGIPNPLNEKMKLSNPKDSEQKSPPNTDDSFEGNTYQPGDIHMNQEKAYNEGQERIDEKDRDKNVNSAEADEEVPCIWCGSYAGFRPYEGKSDEVFCNICCKTKMTKDDIEFYERFKEKMSREELDAYEKYFRWEERNLKS